MLTSSEIDIIGNIINTTWGSASTEQGSFPRGTASPTSVKCTLATSTSQDDIDENNRLLVSYTDIVTFPSTIDAKTFQRKLREIAAKTCSLKLSAIKSKFRAASGRILKAKIVSENDGVQPISSPNAEVSLIASPIYRQATFKAYYRYTIVYEIK